MLEPSSPTSPVYEITENALSVLFVLVVGGGIGWVWYEFAGRAHASDEEPIHNLEEHREQFQLVISMFREDGTGVIHPTWMSPDNVVSSERWGEYRRLFRQLGLDGGVRGLRGDCAECLWFISTSQGFVTHGSSKGYLYRPGDSLVD
jgi:hypothetical protein